MRIEMKVDVGKLRDLVDDDVRMFANITAARHMDPFVPMQSGSLKNNTVIDADGIHYQVPYAHYQWYGEVMAGNPREYTGKDLHYTRSGAGAHWDELMLQNKYDVLLQEIKNHIKEKNT
ncbi:MAG: minor capsid protein [Oscillospiraceae bacterium]|nr:minor capsid protein [Oscillospiraceae bacterium]